MISNKMRKAINKQINAELWSAYLYLSMSMDAEAKALKGIANWFFVQWLEEQDHARIFQNYLNDVGARVELYQIDDVKKVWESPLEMFLDTLKHEQEVTALINDLVRLAIEEGDFATLSRLQWFVDEQVEEEDNADEQVQLFKAATDPVSLRALDRELAERKYIIASALNKEK